jgi:hypothetical protein
VSRVDLPALIGSLAIVALGAVLLLDQLDQLALDIGSLAPTLLAALGTILLASGLGRQRR